jgi:hypothetical protein
MVSAAYWRGSRIGRIGLGGDSGLLPPGDRLTIRVHVTSHAVGPVRESAGRNWLPSVNVASVRLRIEMPEATMTSSVGRSFLRDRRRTSESPDRW